MHLEQKLGPVQPVRASALGVGIYCLPSPFPVPKSWHGPTQCRSATRGRYGTLTDLHCQKITAGNHVLGRHVAVEDRILSWGWMRLSCSGMSALPSVRR